MSAWSTLIQADALAAALARPELVLFDCRFSLADTSAGEAAWRQSRIPGARYAHLDRDLSGAHTPGAGRHPWPDAAEFAAWLGRCGVRPESQVVAYDGGDGAYAARLWWLLRSLGHHRVAVLDGGWARWNALELPLDSTASVSDTGGAAPPAQPYPLPPGGFDRSRLLDADALRARLDAGAVLLDARAGERFRGEVEPIDRIAGHVPGARNRPYAENLHDGRFKPPERLADEFDAMLAGREPSQLVAMCGSGVTACHHLLALAHAGRDGAALYTGSWSGWIEDPQRPVVTGADRTATD